MGIQFSHHVMHEDGRIEHRCQFLETTPGLSPCVPFLRTLRSALSGDSRPLYGSASMPSRNLTVPVAWWIEIEGEVQDPYALLPAVFSDFTKDEVEAIEVGLAPELQEGGAATVMPQAG